MRLKKTITTLVLALCLLLTGLMPASAAPDRLEVLPRDAVWRYSDEGIDLGEYWSQEPDTASWKSGKAPLGFGDDVSETDPGLPIGTVVGYGADGNNKHMTTYFVTDTEIPAMDAYKGIEFYIHVDDGAVVYINGTEAFRKGIADGAVYYHTSAKFKPKEETFAISLGELPMLKEGTNQIAVEVHQDGGDSSDLWFELGMTAITEMPDPIDWTTGWLPNPAVEVDGVSRVAMTFNGDTSKNMGFTWYTNQASIASDLQVMPYSEVEDTDDLDFSGAAHFEGSFARSTSAPEYLVHKAVAAGLTPGSTYWYRVGDALNDEWSDPASFTTDNRDGVFTFINLADSQAKSFEEAVLSAKTFETAYQTVPEADFLVLNGDVVDTGMKEEEWGWVMNEAEDTLLNLPFMAVAGNHDEDSQSFYEHFNLSVVPGSSTLSGAVYSFDYENTHFIMLNTNEDSKGYQNFSLAQINWLQEAARAARERGADWLIVVMHKGPYTTSNHATDDDIMANNGVRQMVAPMFAQLGVDLVLQGHDHIYALSKPINEHNEAVEPVIESAETDGILVGYMVNPAGVVYMIPNTASPKVYYKNKTILESDPAYYDKFLYAEEHAAARYATEADAGRPPRSIIQNFVGIKVTKDSITAIVYEIDRNKGGTPYVLDTFGLLKK